MIFQARIAASTLLILGAVCACEDDEPAELSREADASTADKPNPGHAAIQGDGARWKEIPEAMRPEHVLPELQAIALAPDTSNQGMALFTDVVSVEPGVDVMFCTYTSFIAKEKLYVHDTKAVQSRFGHHAILQYTTTPQPVGTHECPAGGLEQQQNQILGGMGEGQNVQYPANVVSEIPAGAQLMINHHWINASESPVEAQAEIVTVSPPSDAKDLVVARSFIVQSTQLNVPARRTADDSVTCAIDHDVKLISALGHMHEWGSHVKAERMGPEPDVMFDHDFDPVQAIHPMVNYYTVEEPYTLKAGDSVRIACSWNNTNDTPLQFPGEMCVLAAWQVGAEHDTMCFDGKWITP